jgi:hypothetical protein
VTDNQAGGDAPELIPVETNRDHAHHAFEITKRGQAWGRPVSPAGSKEMGVTAWRTDSTRRSSCSSNAVRKRFVRISARLPSISCPLCVRVQAGGCQP